MSTYVLVTVPNMLGAEPQEASMTDKTATKRKLRDDLTAEEREKAERIGSIEFKSAGATRKR
jgi:hypothetical protein